MERVAWIDFAVEDQGRCVNDERVEADVRKKRVLD